MGAALLAKGGDAIQSLDPHDLRAVSGADSSLQIDSALFGLPLLDVERFLGHDSAGGGHGRGGSRSG